MRNKIYGLMMATAFTFSGVTAGNVAAQVRPYRVSDRQVLTLLTRIETRTDSYKRAMNNALDQSVLNNSRSEDSLNTYITDFENATDALRSNFDSRRSVNADVEEVLNRAYYIDGFMRDYRFSTAAQNQWNLVRGDLATLAGYYNIRVNWNANPPYPGSNSNYGNFDTRLTGTYRLNVSQSDDVRSIVDRSSANLPVGRRDNVSRNLERRLTPPDQLAIEKRGNTVTLASSLQPQVTFQADNVARTETNANGRSVRITASSNYDGVSLSYEGDRTNDFYVNFIPVGNGQLRVVRRLYLENRNETVTVASIYDKTNNVARFNEVDGGYNNGNTGNYPNNNYPNNNYPNNNSINQFYIPNGTRLTATLQNPIDTKVSQNGDRISLEVTSPNQYRGAVIEGRLANAESSGRVSGRATVSMEFDTIRLANGQSYRFAGFIDSVRAANGDNVSVNSEGTVRDSNQTTRTATRAGIGAALGAIIGAVAGGGSGAAIGAAVGAGAGAGTVILQGRDNIQLGQGSEFSITSSSPNNVR